MGRAGGAPDLDRLRRCGRLRGLNETGSEAARRPFPWSKLATVGAIPLLLLALGLSLAPARGEFWLGQNYDPSYLYLFGSLTLAEGAPTSFLDHPGVPVQLLGAVVLRLRHLFTGEGALRDAVLAAPESALRALSASLFALQMVVCLAAGAAVLRATGSARRAWLSQSSALLSTTVMANLLLFKAEALLASLLLLAATLIILIAEGHEEARPLVRLLAVVLGLAIATKITAAPFLLVLLIGPRRLLVRLEALAIAVATSGAATLPWSDGLERFLGYLGRLALRRGMYGRGESGLLSPGELLLGLRRLVEREPLLMAILLVGLLVCIFIGRRGSTPQARNRRRWLLALVLGSVALVLMAAKQPNSRFVVPALAVMGPILALCVGDRCVFGSRSWIASMLVGAALLTLAGHGAMRLQQRWRRFGEEGRTAWARAIQAQRQGVTVVPYFWASSPSLALWLGNRASAFRYSAELERQVPGFVVFDVWRWAYRPFSGEMNRAEDLPPLDHLMLHGKRFEADGRLGSISIHNERSFFPPFGPGLPAGELEAVWEGEAEALYRPRPPSTVAP